MCSKIRLWVMLVLTGISEAAIARPVVYGNKPQTLQVTFGTPVLMRFDHPVKTVTNVAQFAIRPASEENPDYSNMMVEARSRKASSFVTFILADGAIVRTKLVAISGNTAESSDSVFEFRAADAGSDNGPGAGTKSSETQGLDLMKAMIRGDKVMGYEVRDLNKSVATDNSGVSAELVKIYAGGEFNGYVFELTNQSRQKTYDIDVRRLRVGEPNLAVLSQADRKTLTTLGTDESKTILRVVARQGSAYRDVVLPVGIVKKDKGGGS